MIAVDLNLLIYALNEDAPQHHHALGWWEEIMSSDTPVGLSWSVLLGFLRITTNPRILPRPLSARQAVEVVDDWLAHPLTQILEPTRQHWTILKELLAPLGTAANLTTDAHLAALSIEHGALLYSADSDFSRFAKLRWKNPLA